jgi:16S rRNA (cytosine967-C5)-methyltransferase
VLPCLRPGGTLTYSTCTIDDQENQAVMAALLARHPELMPDDLRASVPAGLLGAVSPDGWWLQTYPHRHGVDGFFVARVRLAAEKATAGN